MGTVMSPAIYLSLLLPLAWLLLASVRRWRRGSRSRLRIRVYPGSPEHVAGLRAVDAGRSPQHGFWVWDAADKSWELRSGRRPAGRG